MTCAELLQYLSASIDQELDDDFTAAAQEHLATCQQCQVVLNMTQQVILLGHDQRQQAISAAQRRRLFAHLHTAFLAKNPQT